MNKAHAKIIEQQSRRIVALQAKVKKLEAEKVKPMTESEALRLAARDTLEQLSETLDALERVEPITEDLYNAVAIAIDALREYL